MLTHAEPPPRTESSTEWRLTGRAKLRGGKKKENEKNKAASVKPQMMSLDSGWIEGEDSDRFYGTLLHNS